MLHGADIARLWPLNMLKPPEFWPKRTPQSNWVKLMLHKKVLWLKNSKSEVTQH